MRWAEAETARNTGTTLTLALNYGSRSEIVDASRSILRNMLAEAEARGISLEDMLAAEGTEDAIHARFDEQQIGANLYTAHIPTPTSSSAPRASSAYRISCSGRLPTQKSSSQIGCGRISAACIFSKPSRPISSASAASAAWAKPATKTYRKCLNPPTR